MNTADTRRFGGISRLFGTDGFEKLQNAHVVVVGLGGVGSWVAEGLARTAIGRLTLIDGDTVEESNTNRQMPAMDGQYGRLKTEVMAERLRAINPAADIQIVSTFVTAETMPTLIPLTSTTEYFFSSGVSKVPVVLNPFWRRILTVR